MLRQKFDMLIDSWGEFWKKETLNLSIEENMIMEKYS